MGFFRLEKIPEGKCVNGCSCYRPCSVIEIIGSECPLGKKSLEPPALDVIIQGLGYVKLAEKQDAECFDNPHYEYPCSECGVSKKTIQAMQTPVADPDHPGEETVWMNVRRPIKVQEK